MSKRHLSLLLPLLLLLAVAFSHSSGFAQDISEQGVKVKVSVEGHTLTATFHDNATTRALIARFPLRLPMIDLYAREMCYRFPDSLPAEEAGTHGYKVGDIAYWPPRHSFVIFYKQNDEVISNLQKIGRIDSGVEIFEGLGDIEVSFELLERP